MSESIKVVCRFRGGQESEKDKWFFDANGETVKSPGQDVRGSKSFTFDKVLDANSTQESAYVAAGRSSVQSLLNGFNGTIFAYGQSGSGKTFTMLGPDSVVDAIKGGGDEISLEVQRMYGVIPRAIGDIFEAINRQVEAEGAQVELSVQYLEIYNEKVQDLLSRQLVNQSQDLKLREMPNGQMIVMGSEHKLVQSFDDIFNALMDGQRSRAVASTNQNDRSSRSHTIFVISYKQSNSDGSQKSGRLNLVDLAGSERIAKTGATGKTLQEAQKINLSLTSLGQCIKALTDGSAHIPFRDSKLTLFLKDALGGNSKTTLICTASKQLRHVDEAVQTLQFAQRAKKIKNRTTANVMRSPKEMQLMIEKLKAEVTALKAQLIQNGLTPSIGLAIKAGGSMPADDKSLLGDSLATAPSSQPTSMAATSTSQNEDLEESKDSKKDISFNTLLDDSTLSFNPDQAAQTSSTEQSKSSMSGSDAKQMTPQKPSKKEVAQMLELTERLNDQNERLLAVETEYETYKTRTQTEIIELRDKEENAQRKLDSLPQIESLINEMKNANYQLAEKDEEIERIKADCRDQLAKKQDEITNLTGTIKVKDQYIKELEESNDQITNELEKIGYETFTQVKNDLFSKDKENDRLADRRQYLPIYEQFEEETAFLMEKYTQQESTIQHLQSTNQQLLDEIQAMEVDDERMELMSQSQSAATEMMMASDGTMSVNSDFPRFKNSSHINVAKLQTVVEQESEGRRSGAAEGIPSMEDLIEEAKAENEGANTSNGANQRALWLSQRQKASDDSNQSPNNRNSLMFASQAAQVQQRAGSFVNMQAPTRDRGDSMYRDNDSDAQSSVMVREVSAYGSRLSGSRLSSQMTQQVRLVDNTRLSALTNQIMELVLDNIKMLHMNSKLIDYCKRQMLQSDFSVKTLQAKVENTTSNAEQSSEEVTQLQMQIEEARKKCDDFSKLLENERNQYAKTIREKQYNLRSKVNDLNNQNRAEKQNIVRLEMEKAQVKKENTELKDEITKVKANEKKLKEDLAKEKLKDSQALSAALLNSQREKPQTYQEYLAKRMNGGTTDKGVITHKLAMKSKFMNYEKLKDPKEGLPQIPQPKIAAARRPSVLSNPLSFNAGKRQGLNLANNNVTEMLGAAGINADASTIQELEEDCKPDYRAEALDDLDQLANDLASSSDDEKND